MSDYVNYIDMHPSPFDVRIQFGYRSKTLGGDVIDEEFADLVLTRESLVSFHKHLGECLQDGRLHTVEMP